jgi:hypothetical protein
MAADDIAARFGVRAGPPAPKLGAVSPKLIDAYDELTLEELTAFATTDGDARHRGSTGSHRTDASCRYLRHSPNGKVLYDGLLAKPLSFAGDDSVSLTP